ncbi:response regulator [Sphingobacterium sp. E70]|uniref:response regulator n=1 Tax=Sphingobacterium sp. E70 TaxID=2853439 RepID=UPI00211C74E2|nr:response regulator [Sphingobacterium sp. E70]ULT28204.1 response regulator [Sphingobacterium sp. E70]
MIFCDIEMPEHSGLDAIKRLRDYCSHFVFITGYAEEYALQGHKVYVDGFLSKPIEEDELLGLLKHLQHKAPASNAGRDMRVVSTIFLDVVDPNSELHLARRSGPPMRKHPENKRTYEKFQSHLRKLLIWKNQVIIFIFTGLGRMTSLSCWVCSIKGCWT